MALPMWLSGILSGGMNIIGGMLKGWQERKMIKIQHRVNMEGLKAKGKETRMLLETEEHMEWNKAMARGSMTSWKDEYWTIILSIPMIGCFIPKVAPYIMEGFKVLSTTPDWYKAAIGLAIAASFGYRKFADWNMQKHLKTNGYFPKPPNHVEIPEEPTEEDEEIADAVADMPRP